MAHATYPPHLHDRPSRSSSSCHSTSPLLTLISLAHLHLLLLLSIHFSSSSSCCFLGFADAAEAAAAAAGIRASAPSPSSSKNSSVLSSSPPPPSQSSTIAPSPAPLSAQIPGPSTGSIDSINGTLDPSQAQALSALGFANLAHNPCSSSPSPSSFSLSSNPQGSLIICDNASPFRHILDLNLQYCAEDQVFPISAWESLSKSLRSLSFVDCPARQMPLPSDLLSSIKSLRVMASLGRSVESPLAPGLSGVWLSRFHSLSLLSVQDVDVNASSLSFIISDMADLRDIAFANTNLSGPLPLKWPSLPNLQTLQVSGNELHGQIHPSIAHLPRLISLDLSSSNLSGPIPLNLGNLSSLQTLILSSNHLTGTVPASLHNLTSLRYLDLSENHLHGPIPAFLAHMPSLRYLDLSHNQFRGPIPFNESFLRSLNTFRVKGNTELCYNSSTLSAKLVAGLQPCDKSTGLPDVMASSEISPSPSPSF